IAVAKRQATRSFELRAALSLAKLYQSTGRAADAHAVLALVLDGFAPTPAMPEIAEAQALTALADNEEVKADAARRERRAQLQVGLANALMHARGFHAPETRAALDRASEYAPRRRSDGSPRDLLRPLGGQLHPRRSRAMRREIQLAHAGSRKDGRRSIRAHCTAGARRFPLDGR